MKRRNKSWLIAALVALSAVMVLTGCSLSQVLSLTIVDYPATTYVQGPTPNIEFTVAAEMDDGETRELTYNEYSSVLKLSGFSTEEVGTFTATVTYRNVSATFDYEVVAESLDFAGGVGTESNPYMVNNLDQFKNIVKSEYTGSYFKLGADIDFSGLEITSEAQKHDGWAYVLFPYFSGSLDGNGHKLYNIRNVIPNSTNEAAMFWEVGNAVFKNLDIYTEDYCVFIGAVIRGATVTFENVNRYGDVTLNSSENNYGSFMWYNQGKVTMINCNNYVNVFGVSPYAAGFIGQPSLVDSLTMIDCNNYGEIIGVRAAAFFANANAGKYTHNMTLTDCNNYGRIIGTVNSSMFFAEGGDTTYEDDQKVREENLISVSDCVSEVEPVELKAEGYTTSINEDKTISITRTNDQIARIVVVASYFSNDGAALPSTLMRSVYETLTDFGEENNAITSDVRKTTVRKVNEGEDLTSAKDVAAGVIYLKQENGTWIYIHNDTETTYTEASGNVTVNILAFDAAGNLIAGGQI